MSKLPTTCSSSSLAPPPRPTRTTKEYESTSTNNNINDGMEKNKRKSDFFEPLNNNDTLGKKRKTAIFISSQSSQEDEDSTTEEEEEEEHSELETVVDRLAIYGNDKFTECGTTTAIVSRNGVFENVEDVSIQDEFKMKYNHILAVDIGSSFSKCSYLAKKGKTVTSFTLKFKIGKRQQQGSEFIRSCLYYCKEKKIYSLDRDSLKDPIQIDSIKKLFTVLEMVMIEVEGIQMEVSQLMYELCVCVLSALIIPKAKNKKSSELFEGVIFTIPTGTPLHVKRHYKKCVFRALEKVFQKPAQLDDIYIIEEFTLLYYADSKTNQENSLIVDIGHLTTDVAVIEMNEEGKNVIKYANGEVGGVSVIHKKIQNLYPDSFQVMSELFENLEEEELPEKYSNLSGLIEEGCVEITNPILDVILQSGVKRVFIYGAFIAQKYFYNLIYDLINTDSLKRYVNEHEYLLDKFKEKTYEFELVYTENGGSALLNGIANMVSLANEKEISVPLTFQTNIPSYMSYGALLSLEKDGRYSFQLVSSMYNMYVRQDVELFIVKIRNTIDIKKIQELPITEENFNKVGIMEFERFSTVVLYFDPKLNISIHKFTLHAKVTDTFFTLYIHYSIGTHYCCNIFKNSRSGRMERIPINDIGIVFQPENEITTWYGVKYYLNFCIKGSHSNRVFKDQVKEILNDKEIDDIQPNPKLKAKPLRELSPGDIEEAKKHCSTICTNCKTTLNEDLTESRKKRKPVKVTQNTLTKFKKGLDNPKLTAGSLCIDCYNKYRRFYKI